MHGTQYVCVCLFETAVLYRHTGDGLWEKEEDRVSVTVRSFSGEIHVVKVTKREGMEGMRLLYSDEQEKEEEEEDESAGSMWDTLSRWVCLYFPYVLYTLHAVHLPYCHY